MQTDLCLAISVSSNESDKVFRVRKPGTEILFYRDKKKQTQELNLIMLYTHTRFPGGVLQRGNKASFGLLCR